MGDAVARKFAMIDRKFSFLTEKNCRKKSKPKPLERGDKAAFSSKMGDAVARKFAMIDRKFWFLTEKNVKKIKTNASRG